MSTSALKNTLRRWPRLFRVAAMVPRYRAARGSYRHKLRLIRRWVFSSRELSNFTYDLEPVSAHYLACFVAVVTGKTTDEVHGYLDEIRGNDALRAHVAKRINENPQYRMQADLGAHLGRRIGWYAVVRAMKPRVVVETGVDKGLGAVVLATALLRNREEGYDGTYYGTDINPDAGYLFQPPYAAAGRIVYGDSCETLRTLNEMVDLFINDSDHSAEYEAREYDTIVTRLSQHAVILGDNSHVTDKLYQFARKTGRQFLFFQEWPKDHWYPGAGIGAAYWR